jgi:hypothetical protein
MLEQHLNLFFHYRIQLKYIHTCFSQHGPLGKIAYGVIQKNRFMTEAKASTLSVIKPADLNSGE